MPLTERSVSAATSLVDVLRARAAADPGMLSHRFLRDGLETTSELTYGTLDRRARAAATVLLRHAKPGDRVLLAYPPGLEFLDGFFGSLYAGMIAVPAYPPRGQQVDERVRAIAADATPAIALTTADVVERLDGAIPMGDATPALACMSLDRISPDGADEWREPAASRDTVAHLQYTSGSTATPKGVVVTHGNILSNMADLDAGWGHDEASVIVSWLPAFHDMGLVYGLLTPVYTRVPCVLLPPVVFLQRPVRWLQTMTRFAGTHSAAPNFAYDHCARRVRAEDRAQLDLSRWRVAVNGAEPVRPETMDRFCDAFREAGFRRSAFAPGYGLAEATLKVTATRVGDGPTVSAIGGRPLVACGRPILETRVLIADPETRTPVPDGGTGEIWVGGPSVAAGYWRRDAESRDTFAAHTPDGSGPFLRTGDLGLLQDGQLYVTGRAKDLIIIRGQNYYPQDIEATAEQSGAAVRPGAGAAFSIDRDGEERLVVAVEVERTIKADAEAQIDLIRAAIVRDHEIHADDVVLLRPGAVPKTSSGKIQRRACRAAYLDGALDRWSPRSGA